jgi:hypothetical protein
LKEGTGRMGHAYARKFMRPFLKKHSYDRWLDDGTRFLFTNYSFAVVGNPSWYFANPIQTHFRRHYFQLGLLVTLQQTALSALSAWTASAGDETDIAVRRARLSRLHESFLMFSHSFWFGVVSNQLQPREMYDMWQRHVGTPKLYDEVNSQLGGAAEFMETLEQTSNADAATRLSGVATLAAIIGLPATVLSLFDSSSLFHKFADGCRWYDGGVLLAAVGISASLVLSLLWWLGLTVAPSGKSKAFFRLRWLLWAAVLLGTIAGVARWATHQRSLTCKPEETPKCCTSAAVAPPLPPSGDQKTP